MTMIGMSISEREPPRVGGLGGGGHAEENCDQSQGQTRPVEVPYAVVGRVVGSILYA